MNFNLLEEDIVRDIISQCSVISILKLYNVNHHFISKEFLNILIKNRWGINIYKTLSNSILKYDCLNFNFNKKISLPSFDIYANKSIPNSVIWNTNSIICLKYNNSKDKDVALDELLLYYENIFQYNNSTIIKSKSMYKNTEDIKIFKGLIGDAFDLNILAYVNIYKIYEIFKSSFTIGKMSIYKKKYKDNFIENFDVSYLQMCINSKSKISVDILQNILQRIGIEKMCSKRLKILYLNMKDIGHKYLNLLNNIFDNCADVKYNKFRIYIAIQICKFMLIFKEHLEKNNPIVGKMRVYNNSLERKLIPMPGYINDYAIFEISYILSKLA
jgi:hypothetical protein